jgi:hypothetical protein
VVVVAFVTVEVDGGGQAECPWQGGGPGTHVGGPVPPGGGAPKATTASTRPAIPAHAKPRVRRSTCSFYTVARTVPRIHRGAMRRRPPSFTRVNPTPLRRPCSSPTHAVLGRACLRARPHAGPETSPP